MATRPTQYAKNTARNASDRRAANPPLKSPVPQQMAAINANAAVSKAALKGGYPANW
jgi:hypothetical protein